MRYSGPLLHLINTGVLPKKESREARTRRPTSNPRKDIVPAHSERGTRFMPNWVSHYGLIDYLPAVPNYDGST